MKVADRACPGGTETPIEGMLGTKLIEFESSRPTVTAKVEECLTGKFIPLDRRGFAEQAVVLSHQPVAAATAPTRALQGEIGSLAHAYWLTIALDEPLATSTAASFEPLSGYAPFSASPWIELMRYVVTHAEPAQGDGLAYRTFVELADALGMTQEETAKLLGIGRTTPLAWRRGSEPRPARARRLYQTHALVGTLVRRIGREATRRWLEIGQPSPLALIAEGDVAGANDLADELIFGTARSRERVGAWIDDGVGTDSPATHLKEDQPRRVRRRPPRRRTG
jgi:transcriptional regulator with XRE-family HTH domain